ncbi:unnamed protein product [Knipowitschia caucasica]|uniref:Ig-like domain-containing protein n=1 Tax=Knipowitschia caucasica TaxID=637954 RepID=A0AAV2K6X0_KNICA
MPGSTLHAGPGGSSMFDPDNMRFIVLLLFVQVSFSELPTLSLLLESPPSPITCLASGFYPNRATLFWTIDGDLLPDGEEPGEILPTVNQTFQMSVDLDVYSVAVEEWSRYKCVFVFKDGTSQSVNITLDKEVIKFTDSPNKMFPVGLVIGVIVGLLVIAIVFIGACKYKQRYSNRAHL